MGIRVGGFLSDNAAPVMWPDNSGGTAPPSTGIARGDRTGDYAACKAYLAKMGLLGIKVPAGSIWCQEAAPPVSPPILFDPLPLPVSPSPIDKNPGPAPVPLDPIPIVQPPRVAPKVPWVGRHYRGQPTGRRIPVGRIAPVPSGEVCPTWGYYNVTAADGQSYRVYPCRPGEYIPGGPVSQPRRMIEGSPARVEKVRMNPRGSHRNYDGGRVITTTSAAVTIPAAGSTTIASDGGNAGSAAQSSLSSKLGNISPTMLLVGAGVAYFLFFKKR